MNPPKIKMVMAIALAMIFLCFVCWHPEPSPLAKKAGNARQEQSLQVLERPPAPVAAPVVTGRVAPVVAAAVPAPVAAPVVSPDPAEIAGEAAKGNASTALAIRRVISEKWLDGPDKITGRERVRIVEADFKYPMLKLTERVAKDPKSGAETVKVIRSSVADHLMVGLKKKISAKEAESVFGKYGYKIRSYEAGSFALIALQDFQEADSHDKGISDLIGLEEFVDYAEPDFIVHPTAVPNDPDFTNGKMWSLHNPGGIAGTKEDADIDAPEGWAINNDASGVIVAVTDTGINYTHEDLVQNMWTNGAGEHGFDAYENDNDPMDTTGHGTHCAGTIGARGNNGIGITGVAWKVRLMAGRFLGPNGGTTSDAIRVINYARLNGAHIINASWGGGGYSQGLFSAIQACYAADITFVAASGNDGENTSFSPHYPSSYDLPNVVAVAATDKTDRISVFSNYGFRSTDIAAPGSSILSCGVGSNSAYQYLSGTSMAAPHVTGAMALAKAHFPGESCGDLIIRTYSSTDFLLNSSGQVASGRLNLHNLLTASTRVPYFDFFANPYVIPGCEFHWCGNNGFATREVNEDAFSPGTGTRSLWFSWVAPEDGLLTFKGTASQGDVSVVAFEGIERTSLRRMADNFSERPKSTSTLNFYVQAGKEYRFSLDSRRAGSQTMVAGLQFRAANDMFVDSFALPSGGNFSIKGSSCGATAEPFEKDKPHGGRGSGKSVWWHFTPNFSGQVTLTTQGSSFDTVLAVYTGNTGASLVEIGSNDDRSPLEDSSQVTFQAVEGTTYQIAVDSFRFDTAGDICINGFRDGYFAILNQPQNVDAKIGDRVSFSISTLSATTPSYQWFHDDKRLHGEIRSILTYDAITSAQLGGYHCEVKNEVETLVSETAYIAEVQARPVVIWSSGNQSVADGGAVGFSVRAKGTGPFVYTWYKGEVVIPGQDTATLFLNPVSMASAGAYSVSIGNQAGNTVERFTLAIVASPFDGFEWRRSGIGNYAVTDMKSYPTEAYAVAGDTILRTTDGQNWEKSRFPYGFSARSFGIIGNKRICHGYSYTGAAMVATSVGGAPWFVQPLTGLGVTKPGEYRLSEFKGKLIALYPGTNVYNISYSVDGVNWALCEASVPTNVAVPFYGVGQPATDGNTMIVAGADTQSGNQAFYYKTTDGISWTRLQTNAPGLTTSFQADQAVFSRGKFHLISAYGICISNDAAAWTYTTEVGHGMSGDSILVGNDTTAVAFDRLITQRIASFDGPGISGNRTIFPANSQTFTSAASFKGKLLYGTNRGLIGTASDVYSVTFPAEKATALSRVLFQDGFFIASPTGAISGNLISGDGRTWKSTNSFSALLNSFRGRALGRNWADGSNGGAINAANNPILTGSSPFNYFNPATSVLGLNAPLKWIGENPAGDAIAFTYLTSPANTLGLFARANGASAWTQATTPFALPSSTNVLIRYAAGRWYFIASDNKLYSSVNGLNWTAGGTTSGYAIPAEKNGEVFALTTIFSPKGAGIEKTSDGITWTRHAITGLPTVSVVSEFLEYNGSLVTLISGKIYFSSDGFTWARAGLPENVAGIAKGNGQLVVVLTDGGILQTGSAHAGIAAPVVTITSPPQSSSHMLGSPVDVAGELFDPPSGPVSYQCFVDGALVQSGSGTTFSFRFTASNPAGHVIEVVATDPQGLKGADFIRTSTTSSDQVNLLTDGDAIQSINPGSAVVLNGSFYALGGKALYRSRDGMVWERVEIPGSSRFIYGLASGNGALVLQFDDGSLVTSTNGINWIMFTPNQTGYTPTNYVTFSSGLFTATSQSTVLSSADGISWESSLSNETGTIIWLAKDTNGTMVAAGTGGAVFSSRNRGASWKRIQSLPAHSDSIGTYAEGRFVIVSHSAGKSYTSGDGVTWVVQNQPGFTPIVVNVSGSPSLVNVGGTFFTGGRNAIGFSSKDGIVWQSIGISFPERALAYAGGKFIAGTSSGIATSNDAITWAISPGSPASVATLSSTNELILAIGNNGSTWTSKDGISWLQGLAGRSASGLPANGNPYDIASFGSKLLLVGTTGMAAFSNDQGSSWIQGSIDGSTALTSERYIRVKASSQAALAVTVGSRGRVIRTTNGSDWITVAGLTSLKIADIDTDGTTWIAVARTGEILRSTDQGLNWSPVASPLLSAKGVTWFQSRWIIVGSLQSGSSAPCRIYTLESGDTLTDRAPANFNDTSSDLYSLAAHGKLLLWIGGAQAIFSSNGTTWTSTGFNAGGASSYDIYATLTGFRALVGTTGSPTQWQSPAEANAWTTISSPYRNVYTSGNLGTRAFLFGPGQMVEETPTDFSLAMTGGGSTTLGVGDILSLTVTFANSGSTPPPAAAWKVEAFLSKDRFFGDSNDILLGEVPVNVAMPGVGSQISTTLEFEIPERVLTGSNHVVLKLVCESVLLESNTSNNHAISLTPFVTIPEWELALDTTGNGTINQDFAALSYAHNSRVSLTASAGKGLTFAGWSGDALGSESQITVLMNGDKTVMATFSAQASLQVLVRGQGQISGLADQGLYPLNSTASLTAVPAAGWVFLGWGGAATGSNLTANITMNAPKNATARFALPVASWKQTAFSAGERLDPLISGDEADPDGDGIPNWREYLHASDPKAASSNGILQTRLEPGYLSILFTRVSGADTGFSLQSQGSRSLGSWDTPDFQERVLYTDKGIETVEARLPITGQNKGFIRMRYER